ncbi:MAG: PH domain-containing protein, partial [Chloroflexota bacterium]|nr:PH domain-containing protein [Chloroflexota bacterium]
AEEYVITNYRIVQVEGILSKRTFDSALEKVNDVQMTQTVFGRLFGYGNIDIITGSEIGVNHLTGIADPFAFKRGLLESKMDLDGFSDNRKAPTVREDQSRLLAALAELRDSGLISDDEYSERKQQLLSS